MAEFVFMEHPGLDGVVIKVPKSAVFIHNVSGWQLVEGKDKEAVAEKKLTASETEALQPTVEEGAVEPDNAKSARRAVKE